MKKKKLAKFNDCLGAENIERVCFEKMRLELTQMYRIPASDLNGWNLEVVERELEYGAAKELAFRLKNFIVHGEKKEEDWQEFPVTWFDHLKWHLNFKFKTKFKVRMSKIARQTTYMRYCPHVHSPDTSCHVEFLQFKNDFGEYMGKLK